MPATKSGELESAAAYAAMDDSQASQAEVRRLKSSMTSFKGHVSSKVKQVTNMVAQVTKAANASPRNYPAAYRLSLNLQDEIKVLMQADMKHQLAVNAYLSAGEGTAEADEEFYQGVTEDREALGKEVTDLYNSAVVAICKCPAPETPTNTGTSSSVVKPEKELKPDAKLEEGDPIDVYTTWLSQFQTYFRQSNFDRAEPNTQRVYLSKCMDPSLWKRLSGGETATQRALAIDPENSDSGIFAELKLIFGLQDPLLLKRVQLFTTQYFKNQEYESFSAYMARRNLLKKEANFWTMTNEEIDMVMAFHGITDPKLRKKLLSLENPSPKTFLMRAAGMNPPKGKKRLTKNTGKHREKLALTP